MAKKLNNGYNYSSVEDFLQDEYFVNWILHPNAETDHFWSNWIARYPEKRQEFDLAREMVRSVSYRRQERLSPDEYTEMLEHILSQQRSAGTRTEFSTAPFLKVAAAIVLIAAFAYVALHWSGFLETKKTEWLVINTTYGQKRTLYLPDGTKVRLNAGSTISYPEQFSELERSIKFSGEGFFEVTRDENKPFVITSNRFITRVLGTSFNLRSIDEDDDHSVALVTGKVKVTTHRGQSTVLKPDEIAIYQPESGKLEKSRFDSEKVLGWKDDILWFDHEPLPRVFDKLEKWYGVKIIAREGVDLKGHYTGKYQNKSLESILKGITFTSNLKYKINHKTILIYE